MVYCIALISHCNLLYWIPGEVHTPGKIVVSTCLICCFSVIMQSKWGLMFFINIFVYKTYLLYWITPISYCNLNYCISGEVDTTAKIVFWTSVICWFSVNWLSKGGLMLIITIFVYKINLIYHICGQVHTTGKTLVCASVICFFSAISQINDVWC